MSRCVPPGAFKERRTAPRFCRCHSRESPVLLGLPKVSASAFFPPALRLCVNLPIILKSAPWLLDMVVDSCLPLLYLRALNVCQSLISQSDFKMSYLSLRHTAESSDSYRCKVGLIWFSNWVHPVHLCCHRIIVFVIDMIDSCKHSGLAPLNAFLHLPELERNASEAQNCYSAMRPLLLTDISRSL